MKTRIVIGALVTAVVVGIGIGHLRPSQTGLENAGRDVPDPTRVVEARSLKAATAARVAAEASPTLSRRAPDSVFPNSAPRDGNWRLHRPHTLTVAPQPDIAMTFQRVGWKEDGRHATWIGRIPELPGASFVGVATPDGYDAILLLPGAPQYNFHVRGESVLVEEVVATGADCALWPGPVRATEPPSSGIHYAEAMDSHAPGMSDATVSAATAPLTVDVLFLYNTLALGVAADRSSDPTGYIEGHSRAAIETLNLVLQQSRVDTFQWRFAGILAAPAYPAKALVPEDLSMIAPGAPLDPFVQTQRRAFAADQVMLWVGPGERKGVAYVGPGRHDPAPVEGTLAALRLTAGVLILGHELAHNFGCRHDRGHAGSGDGSTATPNGDGYWSYGVLWTDPGETTTSGTVMAYADFLVPYFSNPHITLNVTSTMQERPGPFRDLGTHTIGFVETDPRAAYNARILNTNAAYMAAVSDVVSNSPVIEQQPQDMFPTVGQVFVISVTATGSNLTYQWRRNGANIGGATNSSIVLTAVAGSDASYDVVVSNGSGSVTSRTAVITITNPISNPTPPSPVPTQSPATASGGGGGGAPSGWMLAALVALVAAHRLKGRRFPAGETPAAR